MESEDTPGAIVLSLLLYLLLYMSGAATVEILTHIYLDVAFKSMHMTVSNTHTYTHTSLPHLHEPHSPRVSSQPTMTGQVSIRGSRFSARKQHETFSQNSLPSSWTLLFLSKFFFLWQSPAVLLRGHFIEITVLSCVTKKSCLEQYQVLFFIST